jgi:hypothetical protein
VHHSKIDRQMTEQGHSHHIGTLATLAACLPQLPFQQVAVTISSLHRLASVQGRRCILTTPLWKMMNRGFLALHEAIVSGQLSYRVPAVRPALG